MTPFPLRTEEDTRYIIRQRPRRVFGGEAHESRPVSKPSFHVGRALSPCLRIDEIVFGDAPGRVEQRLGFAEESLRQSAERFGKSLPLLEEAIERTSFLGRDAHSLAEGGIEAANRVSDRDQAVRKAFHFLEAPSYAAREAEANDFADALRAFDRVIDGRGAEFFGESHKAIDVAGRRVAMASAQADDPLRVLDRKYAAAPAAFRRPRLMEKTLCQEPFWRDNSTSRKINVLIGNWCLGISI